MADVVSQLDQMWALLLRTTKSGTWYAGHEGAPGSWSQAEALKDAAVAELLAAQTVSIDDGAYPVLKAVASQ